MSDFLNVFKQLDDSVQKKRVTEPGIYENVKFTGCEFTEQEADPEKKKNAYKCIVLKFAIPDKDDNTNVIEFEERVFAPATTPENVKFLAKKYVKGVEIGKNTPSEQIIKDHEARAIYLLQLIKAFGKTYAAAQEQLMPFVNVPIEQAFVSMAKGFVGLYTNGMPNNPIDMKIVYQNSDKHKTSQLIISTPASNNVAFTQHIPGQKTKIVLSDYDVKCLVKKYTGVAAAPSSDASLLEYSTSSDFSAPSGSMEEAPFSAEPNLANANLF